ncbi:hypothetical protein [Pedobacter sp. SL55]|uniref:hypothetical protein n=1 Tax=Pedobacter sp. SL55 TaxID=2995161 RepID=UPI00226EFF37|nr:hypothetical protein [Pedobacter sp. SL55]WAC42654.1 hypothetical protein OVA16_09955 [Pedobacter sp. SL55]
MSLAVLLFFSSCEPKRLGEETFDLNDFPFGLSVSRFYETELKKEHTKTYYSSCDTSFKDDSGNKQVEVITYLVDAEKPTQPLAKLKNVSFNVIKSIADAEDNLMMISGDAYCGFKDQMKLLEELKKEHGKPVVIQHISGFTTFTWRKRDRTVQIQCEMIPDQNNYYNKKGEYLNPFGGFLKTDNYEPNHRPRMFFYIFNPEAIELLNNHIGLTSSMSGFKPYFYDYTKDTKEPY